MSRDCDYLFSWEAQPYAKGDPAPLALAALRQTGRAGSHILIDGFTLYWSCAKHGLSLKDIPLPIPADQVFERANQGTWEPVKP